MYCSQEDLSSISKELVGKKLMGLYQDWYNGIIYMLFYDPVHGNKIAAIKNNYYAGISILRETQEELSMDDCIYKTTDGYCELHSNGNEYREPCVEGPCDDEVDDKT